MPESALLPYGHIVQINRSGSGSDLPRDQVQQSAFPCAAAAGNKDKFLLFNGKVDLSHRELGGRGCDPLKEGWVGIGADRQLGQTDAQQGQQAPEDQPAPEMRL